MGLLWKKYRITFSLETKDNKCFRYATVEFEQKRNWYWVISENMCLHRCVLNCIRTFFRIMVNLNWIYEGEDSFRLIDEKKLELINKHINTTWNLDWQPDLSGKIRNIKLTYLVK